MRRFRPGYSRSRTGYQYASPARFGDTPRGRPPGFRGGGPFAHDRSDRRRRRRAGGRPRGPGGARGGRRRRGISLRDRPLRPRGRALPEDRRRPARRRARGPEALRRDPAGRGRASRRAAGGPREGDPAPAPLRLPPVCQPPAGPALPRRRDADQGEGAGRHRHGRRPREQRGPVRRRRRLHPQGDARGGGDPDLDQHPGRRRALPALRLRAGRGAGPLAAVPRPRRRRPPGRQDRAGHARGQDQRPDLRPRPLDAGLHRGRARLSRRSRPTISTSTPAACGWSSAPSGST